MVVMMVMVMMHQRQLLVVLDILLVVQLIIFASPLGLHLHLDLYLNVLGRLQAGGHSQW